MAQHIDIPERDYVLHPCERSFLHGYKYAANAVNRWILFPNRIMTIDIIRVALLHLLRTHDSLRFCYAQNSYGQWYRSMFRTPEEVVEDESMVGELDVSSVGSHEMMNLLIGSYTTDLMRKVLEGVEDGGLLLRVTLINTLPLAARTDRRSGQILVMILHHLTHDGWSVYNAIQPLLSKYYIQAERGQPISISRPPTSYQSFCQMLQDYATNPAQMARGPEYWKRTLTRGNVLKFPADGGNGDGFWNTHTISVDPSLVAQIQDGARANATGVLAVITTVLLHLCGQTLSRYHGFIRFLYHGRKACITSGPHGALDVAKTSGLFFCTSFEHVSVSPFNPIWEQVSRVSEQLKGMPNGGIDWNLYSSTEEGAKFAREVASSFIQVNYVPYGGGTTSAPASGSAPPLFKDLKERTPGMEWTRYKGMPDPNPTDRINVFVFAKSDNGWNVVFEYNDAVFSLARIKDLSGAYVELLDRLFRAPFPKTDPSSKL